MVELAQSVVELASFIITLLATGVVFLQLSQLFISWDPFRGKNTPKYVKGWVQYGQSPPLGVLPLRTVVRHPVIDLRLSRLESPNAVDFSSEAAAGQDGRPPLQEPSSPPQRALTRRLSEARGKTSRDAERQEITTRITEILVPRGDSLTSKGLRLARAVQTGNFDWCPSLITSKQRVLDSVPKASWVGLLNSFAIEDLKNTEGAPSRENILLKDDGANFVLQEVEKTVKDLPPMEVSKFQLECLIVLSCFDRCWTRRDGSGIVKGYIGFTGTLTIEWAAGFDCTARFARYARPILELGGFLCPALSYHAATETLLNANGYFLLPHEYQGLERKYVYIAVEREDGRELPVDGEPVSLDHTLIHEYHSFFFTTLEGLDADVTVINTKAKTVLTSPDVRKLLVGVMNETTNLRVKSILPEPIREWLLSILVLDKTANCLVRDIGRLPAEAKLRVDNEISRVGWIRQAASAAPAIDTVAHLLTTRKVCNSSEVPFFCDVIYSAQQTGALVFHDYPLELLGEESVGSIRAGQSDVVQHNWTEVDGLTAVLFRRWVHDSGRIDTNLFYDTPELIQIL